MPANDSLELSRLRGNRESELRNRVAMGTDPQASRLLSMLRGDMADDPYTGEAEQSRVAEIQEGLDEQAFYNRPETTAIRNEQHERALQKLLLPARLQAEVMADRQAQTFGHQQELERMRQGGRVDLEGVKQQGSMGRVNAQQSGMDRRKQFDLTERARLAEQKRPKSIWERLGLTSAPAGPVFEEMPADDQGDLSPEEQAELDMIMRGGR